MYNVPMQRVYQHNTTKVLVLTLGQALFTENSNMLLVIYQDLETKKVIATPYDVFIRNFTFIN